MPVLVNDIQERMAIDVDLVQLLIKVVESALRETGIDPDAEVSLVFTDNDYIAELNQQYRGIDGPTDVLSFAMLEGEPVDDQSGAIILGDVVISVEKAQEQAVEFGHGFAREMAYLTVHGVLHLLGYDHGTEPEQKAMREREEAILGRVLA